MKKILAFDLSSGESGIDVALSAATTFLLNNKDWKIKAYHKEDIEFEFDRLDLIKCSEFIEPTDGVLQIRRKKDSTLVRTIQAVIDGEADAMISAAPSGALVAAGYTMSKALKDLKPAFTALVKGTDGKDKILLDVGANLDVDEHNLEQYAVMGTIYAKALKISDNPTVRLLNIGSEAKKGTKVLQEAHKLMEANSLINFKGNIEANGVLTESGNDIIVTEAYAGNMMLKSYEGAIDFLKNSVKNSMKKRTGKLGLLLMKDFRNDIKSLSNDDAGGAIILGLNHILLKVHGRAKEQWLKNALSQAKRLVEEDLISKLGEAF